MSDLSLVPIEDLVEELSARSDALIVGRYRSTSDKECDLDLTHRGGLFRCIGLARKFEQHLLRLTDTAGTIVKDGDNNA